jgi:hypothetical protein
MKEVEMGVPIYLGNTVIGEVVEMPKGRLFRKTLHGSKHILKRPPAIAFDLDTLRQVELAGGTAIEVKDVETDIVYYATLTTVWTKGFALNRGFGDQQALLLSHWDKQAPHRNADVQVHSKQLPLVSES